MDTTEIAERLVRLETKMDIVIENQKKHEDRHYQVSIKLLFVVLTAIASFVISIIK